MTTIHAINPEMVEMFINQRNTFWPVLETLRYERRPMDQVARTAIHGTPFLFVLPKILGASPTKANPYSTREPENRNAFPADQADVKTAALMAWFKPPIPAL